VGGVLYSEVHGITRITYYLLKRIELKLILYKEISSVNLLRPNQN
jgi:hypothetical protein